jgi:hypothetical protein
MIPLKQVERDSDHLCSASARLISTQLKLFVRIGVHLLSECGALSGNVWILSWDGVGAGI